MQPRCVEDQITALRRERSWASWAHQWLLARAAIGFISAVAFWHPVLLMIAVFLGLIGITERRTDPNQVAARTYPARIWRVGHEQRPVLTIVEAGILIPRYDPKPADQH